VTSAAEPGIDHGARLKPGTEHERGLILGRYRPLRPLGSGGSGSVWLARDETSGEQYALKMIAKEGRAAPRAEREAEAATTLRHPNCLRAYGLEADEKHLYIPYEYVPGSTLRQALRGGQLGDEGAVEAAAQVLDGLAFAHSRGIVHRDVKPSNVLLAEEEHVSVRLFDFGLAQMADAETLTAVGDVPGTLAYISPERLHGEAAGPPADVWAVGVLLWEALAGHHPFWRESLLETGEEIKTGAPSIREARPDLPDGLIAAVDAALSVEPELRPTAASLSRDLRDSSLQRSTRRSPERTRLRLDRRKLAERTGPAALAALGVGWLSAALPFYPAAWPALLAAIAAVLTLARPRLGLALALGVPVFPLGNASFGLAVLYAAVATGWFLLMWGDARWGLLFCTGIVLGPIGLLGLAPLVALRARGVLRRALCATAAVLLAGAVAGLHGLPVPFTDTRAVSLGIGASEHPVAVLQAVWQWLLSVPALGLEALILALAAASLPLVARGSDLTIAMFAGLVLAGTLIAAPTAGALPLVFTGWMLYVVLTMMSRRRPQEASKRRKVGAVLRQTRRNFADRLKPAGGPRWPRARWSRARWPRARSTRPQQRVRGVGAS
jgi:eukaryotic-like serine/threonine-protein kinase